MSKLAYFIISILIIIFIGTIGVGSVYGFIQLPSNISDSGNPGYTVNSTQSINTDVELINESLDGVVTIYAEKGEELSSQGSGFLYRDNYIITNEHVTRGSDEYYIKYKEGDWSKATMVGSDEDSDIAVLDPKESEIPSYAHSLPMQINPPEKGRRVISLGAPNGLDGTVTIGIISGVDRAVRIGTDFSIPDTIQTDTALNPGNSGGPLVSMETGGVVGVNRATEGENIGYAVSSRVTDHIARKIIEQGYHRHSYLGVRTVELNPIVEEYGEVDPKKGLVIRDVITNTPASEVLQSGNNTTKPDVIVSIGGEKVTTNEDIASYLMRKTEPGDEVTMTVYRNGAERKISVELASRSSSNTP